MTLVIQRWALVVTDQLLFPPWGGNRLRILATIRAMKVLGWKVALITIPGNSFCSLNGLVDKAFHVRSQGFQGGSLHSFDVHPFRLVVTAAAQALQPLVAIAEYAWLCPAFASLPKGILRIVDSHDVLSERNTRFVDANLDPWVEVTEQYERALLSYAHIVIAIQLREHRVLSNMLPRSNVVCIFPSMDVPDDYRFHSFDDGIVLAVGANHAGNYGIVNFANEQWPRIFSRIPTAKLYVIGGIASRISKQPGVVAIESIDNLSTCYSTASVVVCPMQAGTGFKVKMAEAIRYGKAVVATRIATEGLPESEKTTWVEAESLDECRESVLALLEDPAKRLELEQAARVYGRRHFSFKVFTKNLSKTLPGKSRGLVPYLFQ